MRQSQSIKSLFRVLQAGTPDVQDAVLDVLYSSLRIKKPPWLENYLNDVVLDGKSPRSA